MRLAIVLLLILLMSNTYAYSISQNNLNISLYIADGGKIVSNAFNLTIAAFSPGIFKSFNLTVPIFPIYTAITTSTSTTTVPQGGGGIGGGLIVCPDNSHYLGNSTCACDFGYAFDEDKNCIFNIPTVIKTTATSKPFIISGLTIILVAIIFYLFISRDEEEKERIRQRFRKKKEEIEEDGLKEVGKKDAQKAIDKVKEKLE